MDNEESCYYQGAGVGGLASHLIDETPGRYVVPGSKWAEIGPSLVKYDELVDPPRAWGAMASQINVALNRVAVTGQGQASFTAGHGGKIEPNDSFANMERVATDVDNWEGQAAVDFIDNYKTQLPYVADHQFTLMCVLAAGLEAEAELYSMAHANVLDICKKTMSGLELIDSRDAAVGGLALTVLGAAGTIALEVASGGTATLVLIAAASEAASVAGTASTIKFDTEDPRTLMNTFFDAIGKVEQHFRARETEIQKGFHDAAVAVRDDLERKSWPEGVFPSYKFKPTGFANGPASLGDWHP